MFWRATDFDKDLVERLQKQLARELQTDAATPVTQNTRLPGFFNHKRVEPHLVTIDYRNVDVCYGPADFPSRKPPPGPTERSARFLDARSSSRRAGKAGHLSLVPPAIAGQHGDVHTFRVCCRLIRGFALNDDQALKC